MPIAEIITIGTEILLGEIIDTNSRYIARTIGLVMACILGTVRSFWGSSPIEAIVLTAIGIVIFGLGIRMAHALGPDEVDLLKRSGLPGRDRVVALLAPRYAGN